MNRYRLVREYIKFLLIISAFFLVPLAGFAQDNTQPFVTVRPLHTLDHRLGVSSLSWSPNGNLLVTTGMNSSDITVWDVRSGRPVQVLQRKLAFGESLDFSPDGRFLITSAAEDHLGAALTVWDAETWKIVRHVSGIFSDKPPAYSAARRFSLSAVSGKIAYFSSLSPQSSITILDISTWEQLAVLTGVTNIEQR